MDGKKIITDIDIDDLMSDWIERDGTTFVHARKKGRLGWEKSLEKGDALSDYFLPSDITKHEVIKRAYSIARDLIVVMDPPYKVHIKLTNGISCTDSKVVCVDTAVFDDKSVALGEQIDIFCGLAIHEGCHLCYTSFTEAITKNKVVHEIFNILEDERIETLCGDLKPGLAGFLAKTKYYYFDKYYTDTLASKKGTEEKMNDFEKLFSLFFKIVRYPKYLDEETIVKYARYLIEIKKAIIPYPISTIQTYEAAEKVYEIIKALYVEEEKEKRSGGSGEGDGESSDKKSGDKSLGSKGKSGEKSTAEKISSALDMDKKDTRSSMEKAMDSKAADDKIAEEADKIIKELDEHSVTSSGVKAEVKKVSEDLRRDHGLSAEEIEGLVSFGSSRNTIFIPQHDRREIYMHSYNRIKQYIPAISRILKGHCRDYKLVLRSMRSGVLDTTKLAEAIQGVPNVYLREGEVYTDKITAVVLIDESGSMGGERISAARDTAILLSESLKNLPDVECYIYGHSADEHYLGSTELRVYKDKNHHPRYSLGSVTAHRENRDGIAILETAKAVRKQTSNNVVMFVISDGEPCACDYHGSPAMYDVHNKVTAVEKMGFSVVQVCINASYDPKKMFKNFVVLENMNKLAVDLGKVIKKAIISGAKVHTRM